MIGFVIYTDRVGFVDYLNGHDLLTSGKAVSCGFELHWHCQSAQRRARAAGRPARHFLRWPWPVGCKRLLRGLSWNCD